MNENMHYVPLGEEYYFFFSVFNAFRRGSWGWL